MMMMRDGRFEAGYCEQHKAEEEVQSRDSLVLYSTLVFPFRAASDRVQTWVLITAVQSSR